MCLWHVRPVSFNDSADCSQTESPEKSFTFGASDRNRLIYQCHSGEHYAAFCALSLEDVLDERLHCVWMNVNADTWSNEDKNARADTVKIFTCSLNEDKITFSSVE